MKEMVYLEFIINNIVLFNENVNINTFYQLLIYFYKNKKI